MYAYRASGSLFFALSVEKFKKKKKKQNPANLGDKRQASLVRKSPWTRAWQFTPVLLPKNPMDRGAWWTRVHGSQRVGHD